MAKTTTKTVKTPEAKTFKATQIARKGALAYVGLYVAAYEAAKPAFANLTSKRETLFNEFVEKGEAIEAQAQELASTATSKVGATFTKARGFLPKAANDRVVELEAEIATLNKKITQFAKKAKAEKAA